MRRHQITTFEGPGVIRSTWRRAKAELRRASRLSYSAAVKVYRGPAREGAALEDGHLTGGSVSFHESAALAKQLD